MNDKAPTISSGPAAPEAVDENHIIADPVDGVQRVGLLLQERTGRTQPLVEEFLNRLRVDHLEAIHRAIEVRLQRLAVRERKSEPVLRVRAVAKQERTPQGDPLLLDRLIDIARSGHKVNPSPTGHAGVRALGKGAHLAGATTPRPARDHPAERKRAYGTQRPEHPVVRVVRHSSPLYP